MLVYLAYLFDRFIYPFFLIGRKKVNKNTYQMRDDIKLSLRENTIDVLVVGEVFTAREYEAKAFDIEPTDIVVDIGAHIGVFAVYAARKASKGVVLAYEPFADNFVYLEKNKEINHLSNLKIFNRAVTSTGNDADLYISAVNTGGHSIYKFRSILSRRTIRIQSTSLKDIIEENKLERINYLKIDTEGAEFDIILNTSKSVLDKIDKMIIEYHDYLPSDLNHFDIIRYLEGCGFKVTTRSSFLRRLIVKTGLILAKRDTGN